MLHILLTILKVIGILVLVILVLLVLLILIVLFVPVRYRVHVRKEGGPLEADGLVSWLLKMLRVTVQYRKKSGLAQIWVLWLRIKSIRIPDSSWLTLIFVFKRKPLVPVALRHHFSMALPNILFAIYYCPVSIVIYSVYII